MCNKFLALVLCVEGTLTIEGLDFSPLKHQVILDNMRVEVVNEKFKEFSLVPVKTIDLPYQSDMKLESLHFSATSECYTAWVLALEDAIKVCYVKSLLSGFRGRTQVSMEWYKKQYEQYEKAMNTIEYGSNFVLHTSASNTVKKNLGTVRIWLQADEEDTGLMFFPAVDESATSHSSSFRKTTFSSLEHGDGNNRRTFDNSAGSSQISNEAFHTDIINCGIVLPFYHILGVSKGTKDKIVKCNSSRYHCKYTSIQCVPVLIIFLVSVDALLSQLQMIFMFWRQNRVKNEISGRSLSLML